MLYIVVYRIVTISFRIILFFILFSVICKSHAILPTGADDEIVLIEHLPRHQVHLQDFFWSGGEDVPSWVESKQLLTFYETKTIHHKATVYLPDESDKNPEHSSHSDPDSSPGPYGSSCTSCISSTPTLPTIDENTGILLGDDPGPRYWLLTVLQGGNSVPPKIELRLARLYRTAFKRQQERHLGILGDRVRRASQNNSSLEKQLSDAINTTKHNLGSFNETQLGSIIHRKKRVKLLERLPTKRMRLVRVKNKRTLPFIFTEDSESQFEELTTHIKNDTAEFQNRNEDKNLSLTPPNNTIKLMGENDRSTLWNSIDPILFNSTNKLFMQENYPHSSNNTVKLQMVDNSKNLNLVQVRMQNTSVIEGVATKLIYSVHLGGKPVPAETAAKDMALLSTQEVALELGTLVLIQSEPYLKATRPLALSRKKDAYLLVGAAATAILLLFIIVLIITFAVKKKRAQSSVAAPSVQDITKRDEEYTPTAPGHDNAVYSSETETRTDGINTKHTPVSLHKTVFISSNPDTQDEEINDFSSENNEDKNVNFNKSCKIPWDELDNGVVPMKTRSEYQNMRRTKGFDHSEVPESVDSALNHTDPLESLENGLTIHEGVQASPRSYLSMPSCKQFPNMKSVEPLSRVLEPIVMKHLDIELDSPELEKRNDFNKEVFGNFLKRGNSAINDPGVVGPIVWDLRRKGVIEVVPRVFDASCASTVRFLQMRIFEKHNVLTDTSATEAELEPFRILHGTVGRAGRRLHKLLEDSFSLFGNRETKPKDNQSTQRTFIFSDSPDYLTALSETKEKFTHNSSVEIPTSEIKTRPKNSMQSAERDELIEENDNTVTHPRTTWGSRPLSAGPFHRPTSPEVNVIRVLASSQLPLEDPAVPLIDAIKKELRKFSAR